MDDKKQIMEIIKPKKEKKIKIENLFIFKEKKVPKKSKKKKSKY